MKKLQNSLAVFVLVVMALPLILCGCAGQATSPSSTPPTTTTPASTLSEQPDEAAFLEYFSEMSFGKVPAGATSPADF